jgi:hypothetical protein
VDHIDTHDALSNHSPDPQNQTQPIGNSPHDLESSAQLLQTSAETPPHAPEQPDSSRTDVVEKPEAITVTRKDKHRLHSMRHAVLSRYPLEALVRLGENIRSLRQIERKFRAELKPSGIVAEALFDRFFSCYLRCLLVAKAEATAFAPIDQPAGGARLIKSLKEREVPTLVIQDSIENSGTHLSTDLLRQLALVARYDAHFSKEMYRALGMLLILRSGGEVALEQCAGKILGINKES